MLLSLSHSSERDLFPDMNLGCNEKATCRNIPAGYPSGHKLLISEVVNWILKWLITA